MNRERDQFGDDRLAETVMANRNKRAVEIIDNIVAQVEAHADGEAQADDLTIVVIKRTRE
jgi:serine phosphatase RsbU (regulator of sigma subunit)